MDDEINVSAEELQHLSNAEKQQLQTFIQTESQRSNIQKTVHELTEMCFKKCITGSISSGKLASKEESCMSNCVNRFMDSNLAVLQHLEKLRAQQ
ncbi:Mitochondrial import inner membrane translocase subunit tim8 [Rhinocladiella similis]